MVSRPRLGLAADGHGGASGAAMACRRSVWDDLGGFEERLFAYLEDADLSLAYVATAGWRSAYVPTAWSSPPLRILAQRDEAALARAQSTHPCPNLLRRSDANSVGRPALVAL